MGSSGVSKIVAATSPRTAARSSVSSIEALPVSSMRRWQREAFFCYEARLKAQQRTMLWEATPGAGKTTAALEVVAHQLRERRAKRALVVVPTSHLKIQWARAAAKRGIDLDCNFSGGRQTLGSDFHGAVVTYQQFGIRPSSFKALAADAVIILDEVHHTGDGLTWGNAVQSALSGSSFILCLSGTAFRSDNNPIPFVTYDETKSSLPDYTYGYANAVADRVCRPVAVFTYGGEVSWLEGERVYQAAFDDRLDPMNSAKRLRAALDPAAGWVQPMLRDAHETLMGTRSEQPNAGALLVCANQTHARKMATVLAEISGERPTVVLSDDASASRKIKEFSDSNQRWLVACNMVSEGVDIPRLRLGVYATTIRTKMYFRQFVGRIVRRQAHVPGVQVAYLYVPADPTLHVLAEEIEAESRHILGTAQGRDLEDDWRRDQEREPPQKTELVAVSAVNSGINAVIVQGSQLTLFGTEEGGAPTISRELVSREVESHLAEALTRSEVKAAVASEIKLLVGQLHRRTGMAHAEIHTVLNRKQHVRSQTYCTEDQLLQRREILREMLKPKLSSSTQRAA